MGLFCRIVCQCDACGAQWDVEALGRINDNGVPPAVVAKNLFRRDYAQYVLCDMCAAPLNHKLKEIIDRARAERGLT